MRSPFSLFILSSCLASFPVMASLASALFAQTADIENAAKPSRLPASEQELIEQLPDGCVAAWLGSKPNAPSQPMTVCGAPPRTASYKGTAIDVSPSTPIIQQNPYSKAVSHRVSRGAAFRQVSTEDDLLSDDLEPERKPKAIAKATQDDDQELTTGTPNDPLGALTDDLLMGGADDDDLLNGGGADQGSEDDGLLDKGAEENDPLAGMAPTSGPIKKSLQADGQEGGASKSDSTAASASHPLDALYPTAQTCAKCHQKHYDEWRMSAHAYATISPMFQRFEQAMQKLTQGTVGAFCFRCHSPVAVQLNIPSSTSVLEGPPVMREGITCVVCHRVSEAVGRTHGDRRIEPGDIHAPIYSSSNGEGVKEARAKAKELKLKLSADEKGPGQPMHKHCGPFEPISKSDFCASCHQVAVWPGIWLEIVHAQYRSGPANAKGITCQDCHMGAVPGKSGSYELDYCAVISEKPFGEPRKHSNHVFWGPNYSIAHPGIFPHNPKAQKYSHRQWLAFEYRNGWGTKEFEKSVPPGAHFPPPWDNADERIEGRKLIDENLKKLEEKRAIAAITLAAGAQVEGPMMDCDPKTANPLRFKYRVTNISDGHNIPTGSLGAQPQLWLNVALIDPTGARVWETGYLDSNGDLCDLQSVDVNNHRMAVDAQLFNLQTKFLVNNGLRGTDREAPAPLNFSVDQLIFLRPPTVPVAVLNHAPLIRMEAHSIPPLDSRVAHYVVPPEKMLKPGLYRLSSRLRSRPEPPYFMRLVGASPEMIRRLNENIIDFEISSHTFVVQDPIHVATPRSLFLR
jgi:hypothetical protein